MDKIEMDRMDRINGSWPISMVRMDRIVHKLDNRHVYEKAYLQLDTGIESSADWTVRIIGSIR